MWCPSDGVYYKQQLAIRIGKKDRTPNERVTWWVVLIVFVNFGPIVARSFFPHNNFSIIRARSKNGSKSGVCPSNLPHWTFMSSEGFQFNSVKWFGDTLWSLQLECLRSLQLQIFLWFYQMSM
jgi:hypothetical protein